MYFFFLNMKLYKNLIIRVNQKEKETSYFAGSASIFHIAVAYLLTL